ncbi:YbjN domain-containing protein [Herbivorax sp. ANBcel31]|uniref:YbjN domain-containing protein n=1 Tax=Herbivorax sp. ANBcel31 TaxID=3069754 RepID=UPI0027B273E1|nr:YbjN domain-containing protein [Herbivorax sp. ANBcel31]MDQ2085365.1 YbjN domain-containing protein [Herbivorax sp. ANBcel31]
MSEKIIDVVREIAKENGWAFNEINDLIKIDVEGKNGTWSSFCKCLEEEKKFIYYSVLSIKVPKDKILRTVEFITRLNYGLKIGNFEIDMDTGEFHFKTAVQLIDNTNSHDIIGNNIIINILTMDEFLPLIMKIIYSDTPIKDILE